MNYINQESAEIQGYNIDLEKDNQRLIEEL